MLLRNIHKRGGEIIVFTAAVKDYADKCLDILGETASLISHILYRDHCVFISSDDLISQIEHEYECVFDEEDDEEEYEFKEHHDVDPLDVEHDDESKCLENAENGCRDPLQYVSSGKQLHALSGAKDSPVHHLFFKELMGFQPCFIKDLSRLGRDLRTTFLIDDNPISYALQPLHGIPIPGFRGDDRDRELKFCELAIHAAIEDGGKSGISGISASFDGAIDHIERFRKPIYPKGMLFQGKGSAVPIGEEVLLDTEL
ncbi:hypothetical protein ADUPG1_012930 [Aduncisulcus paluster]|uniref:Mitochondrial import inner membrane translocase subunit TIM50 n=1 Tax=Aduncisulcus paluster TaxID=2918883 RepID=A0ABQ5K164_9EUKA|nr:hypothetical protein ADUPG1_012930 [Aduncisulcus paluster]